MRPAEDYSAALGFTVKCIPRKVQANRGALSARKANPRFGTRDQPRIYRKESAIDR
jgi:hypothetical protein